MILDFFRNDLLELCPGWLSELNNIVYLMFINEYNGVKLLTSVTPVSCWSKKDVVYSRDRDVDFRCSILHSKK